MYKSLLIIFASVLIISCKQNSNKKEIEADAISNPMTADGVLDTSELPILSFDKDVYDFGKIKEGEKVSYSYTFTNTGKSALIVSNATATCGCTIPKWSQEPIKPGEKGVIKVIFDSKGKTGLQNKTITVIANTIPNTKVLYLRGDVAGN